MPFEFTWGPVPRGRCSIFRIKIWDMILKIKIVWMWASKISTRLTKLLTSLPQRDGKVDRTKASSCPQASSHDLAFYVSHFSKKSPVHKGTRWLDYLSERFDEIETIGILDRRARVVWSRIEPRQLEFWIAMLEFTEYRIEQREDWNSSSFLIRVG